MRSHFLVVCALAAGCVTAQNPSVSTVPCPGAESMEPVLLPLGLEQEPGTFGPRYVSPRRNLDMMERELARRQVTDEGIATVRILVLATGEKASQELISNTGGYRLGEAAEAIARQLDYLPATRGGCGIPSFVDFQLRLRGGLRPETSG